jgi:hypothetical protein
MLDDSEHFRVERTYSGSVISMRGVQWHPGFCLGNELVEGVDAERYNVQFGLSCQGCWRSAGPRSEVIAHVAFSSQRRRSYRASPSYRH